MDISKFFANFDHYDDIRIIYVNFKVVEFGKKHRTELSGNFRRFHREALIASLCLDLECFKVRKRIRKIYLCFFNDIFPVLFGNAGSGESYDSENFLKSFNRFVKVDILFLGFDINGGLCFPAFEFSKVFKTALAVFNKSVFKTGAVKSFKGNFAAFYKYNFFHLLTSLSAKCAHCIFKGGNKLINIFFFGFSSETDSDCAVDSCAFITHCRKNMAFCAKSAGRTA